MQNTQHIYVKFLSSILDSPEKWRKFISRNISNTPVF